MTKMIEMTKNDGKLELKDYLKLLDCFRFEFLEISLKSSHHICPLNFWVRNYNTSFKVNTRLKKIARTVPQREIYHEYPMALPKVKNTFKTVCI